MHALVSRRFNVTLLLFALAAGGCAGVSPPPLPSEELRKSIGTLGVVGLPSEGATDPEMPTRGIGEGAKTGARQGALGAYASIAEPSCDADEPSGILCALGVGLGAALAPIGAIVGAGVGAGRARSTEEVEAAQAGLIAVLTAATPEIELRDRVVRRARSRIAVEALTGPAGSAAAGLAGVDTVLELYPTRLGVITEGEISPSLKVVLGVRGILVDAVEGRGLYVRSWMYRGEGHDYFELGADGGARLEAELERAYDNLAKKIVHDLIVAADPAPEEVERDGTAWAVEATEFVGWLARMVRIGSCFEGQKMTTLRVDGESLLESYTRRPLEHDDLTLSPGRHEVALACAGREQMGAFVKRRCGQLVFLAEPGGLYRPDWPAPDRLSLIDIRTGRAVGAANTWSERSGFFDSVPCEK